MAPTLSLLLLASLASLAAADLCPEPVIPNGGVAGRKADNFFMGQVKLQHIYFFTTKIENHAYNTGKPIPLEVLHYVTLEEEQATHAFFLARVENVKNRQTDKHT